MHPQPGLSASVSLKVADADTAAALRSGTVAVLGTPRIVALCEEACCLAVEPQLLAGETTVGSRVELSHLAPSPVGAIVTAEATLERVEGRRLTFTVSVTDPKGLVAAGKITRVAVDAERFVTKSQEP